MYFEEVLPSALLICQDQIGPTIICHIAESRSSEARYVVLLDVGYAFDRGLERAIAVAGQNRYPGVNGGPIVWSEDDVWLAIAIHIADIQRGSACRPERCRLVMEQNCIFRNFERAVAQTNIQN